MSESHKGLALKEKNGRFKTHWYVNPITYKEIAIKEGNEIPEGFIKGRLTSHFLKEK